MLLLITEEPVLVHSPDSGFVRLDPSRAWWQLEISAHWICAYHSGSHGFPQDCFRLRCG
jgi:hypothetical protein